MNDSLAWSEPIHSPKPLLLALAIALVLHLGLLLIHFITPTRSLPAPSLPVVQIDLQAMPPSPPPEKAEMLAERDQRATEASRAAAPQTSTETRPTLAAAVPPSSPPEPKSEPKPEPEPSEPPEPTPPPKETPKPPKTSEKKAAANANKAPTKPTTPITPTPKPPNPPAETTPTASLTERGLQMARLKSDVLQQSLRDEVNARSAVLTANTRYGAEAAYLNAWVNKVETIGNHNYPDEARRKNLSGRLMLEVKIDAWGKVLAVHVRQSSGLKVLDEAAQNIVRMGEPYAKFPLEMREKYDQITILRTWSFGSAGLDTR